MRYAWLTDIHFEFLSNQETTTFVQNLARLDIDGLFLTGDISVSKMLISHLELFDQLFA